MEALSVVVVVVVSATATGVFLSAVWRFVVMPPLEGVPDGRRAVVFLAILAIGVVPIGLAFLDLSDRQAFLVIALVTVLGIGIGVGALTTRPARVRAGQDENHQ